MVHVLTSEKLHVRVKTWPSESRRAIFPSVCVYVCVAHIPATFVVKPRNKWSEKGPNHATQKTHFKLEQFQNQPCFMKLTSEINICGKKGGLTQEIPWFNSPHHMACQWHHGCTLEAIGDVSEGQVHGRRAQAWKKMGLSWENRDHIVGYHPTYTNMMVTCMFD